MFIFARAKPQSAMRDYLNIINETNLLTSCTAAPYINKATYATLSEGINMQQQDQPISRRILGGIGREIRLIVVAFIPFKNIEPIDIEVKPQRKDPYGRAVSFGAAGCIIGIFVLAYGLYPDNQVANPVDVLRNLLPEDTSLDSLISAFAESVFYNAVFIGIVFVILGYTLGVPFTRLVWIIRLGIYSTIAQLTLMWCIVYNLQMPDGGWKFLAILTVGPWWWLHTISMFIYILLAH